MQIKVTGKPIFEISQTMNLGNIRIVLVEPSHPGNIGGVARAMKNMGILHLVLVSPKRFPSEKAQARASGAGDVLANAKVVSTMEEALEGCNYVCGTTTRDRSIDWPTMDPRQFAERAVDQDGASEIAVVFGRESGGLTNAELDRCHVRVAIPANADYPSLNLVSAVQVICYELLYSFLNLQSPETAAARPLDDQPVSAEDMERFYEHLEKVLVEIDFLNPAHPKKLMRRLKRLFNRASPVANEMNILRGILTAVQSTIQRYTRT